MSLTSPYFVLEQLQHVSVCVCVCVCVYVCAIHYHYNTSLILNNAVCVYNVAGKSSIQLVIRF